MFTHNFKYALKTLFKNKMLIFWTFAFPIILGTFFYLAFSNIENSEKLDLIDIAIVDDASFQKSEIWKQSFETLGREKSKEQLFRIQYVDLETAQELLNSKKITGYLTLVDKKPKIVVMANGINETIFKYVTEEISQIEQIMQKVTEYPLSLENYVEEEDLNIFYAKVYGKVLEMIQENDVNIEDISSNHLSYTMIEFYTLIAMACLYGGILGMVSINQNLANMSNTGKRVAVGPVFKGKLIIGSILASYIAQLIGLLLLFIYTIFILHVDYGNHFLMIILLTLVGSFAGLSLGIMIATLLKTNENVKTGVVIAVTMLGCFLSGMMGITMKYVIDKNIPIINKLNPASMITDGFYSLYYYDTFDRFYFNVISLLIFAFFMIGISMFSLRRQKYDSI